MRLSGLQKDVLALYRGLLRSALKKDKQIHGQRDNLYNHVRIEFREKANSVSRTEFKTIEYMLRNGYKQKKLIDMPGFTGAASRSSTRK